MLICCVCVILSYCDTVWTVLCSSVAKCYFVNICWQLANTGVGNGDAAASRPEQADLPVLRQVVNKCLLFFVNSSVLTGCDSVTKITWNILFMKFLFFIPQFCQLLIDLLTVCLILHYSKLLLQFNFNNKERRLHVNKPLWRPK